jgi:hypothetical protein
VSISEHPSTSTIQCSAEAALVAGVSAVIGVPLTKAVLAVGDCKVELDGYNAAHGIACEAYAHVGELKAGQSRKLATDILKLALVGSHLGQACRKILVIAGAEAEAWLKSKCWQAGAAKHFSIEVMRIELSADMHREVVAAQVRQFR